jgi:hypothetical protein
MSCLREQMPEVKASSAFVLKIRRSLDFLLKAKKGMTFIFCRHKKTPALQSEFLILKANKLTFAELVRTAGFGETVFFTLYNAVIAC